MKGFLIFLAMIPLGFAVAYADNFQTHIIEDNSIDESSGLAVSNYSSELLWTHNDSGNTAIIYALSTDGKKRASVFLEGVFNRDWEDLSSFRWQDQGYLLIADSGNNWGLNLSSFLHIFKEPKLANVNSASTEPVSREPAWSIEYDFEDGNLYDVEAVAVDIHSEKILLLSKEPRQVKVFELPLFQSPDSGEVISARKIAEIDYLKYPSAMDISTSGSRAAILSYGRVYLFNKTGQQSWADVFEAPDSIIKYRGLYQPEALCFDKKAQRLFISSEKLPAKLLTIQLP